MSRFAQTRTFLPRREDQTKRGRTMFFSVKHQGNFKEVEGGGSTSTNFTSIVAGGAAAAEQGILIRAGNANTINS